MIGRRVYSLLGLVLLALALPGLARADLKAYIAKPEPAYRWEKRGEESMEGVKVYDLHLVSQTWQGITWEHRLQIFRPEKLDYPRFCTIYNTGGSGSRANTEMGARLARETGATYAILFNIPNQPLYGGKTEDGLIVYTWIQFLQTGDESWPLHFPMAKAVVKSMDAIQAFAKEQSFPEITEFLVHGASKRGWTTWLAAASGDPRIKAIAPMVIDVLNVPAQMPHQLEAYGKPSEQIGDYTSADMFSKLQTKEGQRLIALEDPYSYREELTLPKLLILGTNDRYWAQDALNLYWDDLKGPKWVTYTPNSGHGLEDREHVYATLASFIRMNAAHGKWPKMRWRYADLPGGGATLWLGADMKPLSARLFHVSAPTQDFRDSKWTSEPMHASKDGFEGRMDAPAQGYTAVFGEATYEIDGKPFTLSTQIRILGSKQSAKAPAR